jgi:tRNA pseudouridine synthase 9
MVVNPTMVATEVPQPTPYPPLEEKKPLKEPPPVVITPCDPWPRPYCLENGLRRVAPYHFTYNTYCKERWRGRELLDIFASEFRDRPLEYYVSIPAESWNGLY